MAVRINGKNSYFMEALMIAIVKSTALHGLDGQVRGSRGGVSNGLPALT
jgi:hypothetical protein